ncbi:hypothetical protein SAMD00019534_111300 [Acytostelium subglobosum LB1]|nr:hypothetical protein SAMD00019534_111300 [Acytostelium subglobosum LB1]GAM27954.1 hypothetical protein SAMD00019534_111300 [Acytostelium subglobosum LB1]|eukprot:XP_012749237.1 hypothetical protein SAMD00019534_111300 [Acytostelium subglobosum LB1]
MCSSEGEEMPATDGDDTSDAAFVGVSTTDEFDMYDDEAGEVESTDVSVS